MDREALVLRNRAMAEAFHRPSLKHQFRNFLLGAIAQIPLPKQKHKVKTNRILLIRPDHIGDMLLTTPAILALKHTNPQLELHVLAGSWSAPILANYDEIDLVLTLDFPGFSRQKPYEPINPYVYAYQSAQSLRKIGYDAAVIFRPDHWWGALLAHLAGIPSVIGYDRGNVRPFLTTVVPFAETHVVLQNLALVSRWLPANFEAHKIPLEYPLFDADRQFIKEQLSESNIEDADKILCIHPGAGTTVKQWSVEKWAEVADRISGQLDAKIIFTGSSSEATTVKTIIEKMKQPALNFAGTTNISQLGALYQRSIAVLGADSGPLHLAVAVDTPTVTLFGPAKLAEFAPWGSTETHIALTSDIGCIGCGILDWGTDPLEYHPCMLDISVSAVLQAARNVVYNASKHQD